MYTRNNISQKRFFITGGAGFIGSHLVDHLLKAGHKVISIDNLSTGNMANLTQAINHPNHRFCYQNLLDFAWDKELMPGDIIVHLAATVGVEKVGEKALLTAHNNLYPTQLLLDKCLSHKCKLIYASTSEVYGDSTRESCSEEDVLSVYAHHGGRSAYTLAKLYGEFLGLTYARDYNLPVTILRFFNTIGLRQSPLFGMVVPRFIAQAIHNKPITVYDDGLQTRSFCDVSDMVRGIYAISLSKKGQGQIYNLGNDQPITILELARYIRQTLQSNSKIIFKPLPPERANNADIRHRKPNLRKIRLTHNWKPEITWQKSVTTIAHHTMANSLYHSSQKNAI